MAATATPATPTPTGRQLQLELWTDCAVKYIPVEDVTAEDEMALVEAALAQQGSQLNVAIAKEILEEPEGDLDRPFLPTLWEQEAIKAREAERARQRPATVELELEDEPEDDVVEDDGEDDDN